MRTYHTSRGPFNERHFLSSEEVEQICADELRAVHLYPAEPMPIRIERFIEKRFRIHPRYEDLSDGILGFSQFGTKGLEQIVVSRSLAEDTTRSSERRVNTTLAHETGHGLLHAHLFAFGVPARPLFDDVPNSPKVLCRNGAVPGVQEATRGGYDGHWWEFQANMAIGALLLPKPLVEKCLGSLLIPQGTFGRKFLDQLTRREAAILLAETFDVNPVVARIRLDEVYPINADTQLTL